MGKEILLSTKGLCKDFGPTRAVDHVDIEIYKGEIRGLIGENGSGKSTTASIFSGVYKSDAGEIDFFGKRYKPVDQVEASHRGCTIIMQEMNTIEGLAVSENMFLGNESEFIKGGLKNSKLMNAKAKQLLVQYGLGHINPGVDIGHYSFEERKMIELVKAVHNNPELFIVDETTTALSQKGRDQLYDVIKKRKSAGKSVLFISHDLIEVLDICDTITVFRDGKHISTVVTEEVTEADLKRLMVGRELGEKYYRGDYGNPISEEIVLKVENITVSGEVEQVSFELHKGEILGIGGLTDCGMHELGKVVFGAIRQHEGTVTLCKNGLEVKEIKQAIDNGIGYVSKNRDEEALMINSSIKDNICLISLDDLKRGIYISKKKERQLAKKFSEQLQVKMTSIEQYISALSGGNKQKVSIAKWLAKDSDIFVLDCPTRGIDVMVKATIYELMYELKMNGKSIVMISEELLELIGMCDRILILKHGKINGTVQRSEFLNEEEIIHYMI